MTEQSFQELTLLLRKNWTKRSGILMRLQRQEEDLKPLLLTVGRIKNKGLRAEYCKLWDGANLLYDGPFESADLLSILNHRGICYGELNTATKLDVKQGVCYCFGEQVDPGCDLFCSLRNKPCSTSHSTTPSQSCSDKSV